MTPDVAQRLRLIRVCHRATDRQKFGASVERLGRCAGTRIHVPDSIGNFCGARDVAIFVLDIALKLNLALKVLR